MGLLLIWAVVASLLALWSGLVWTGQALLVGMLSHVGSLGSGGWSVPEAVTSWLPVPMAEWLISTVETLTPQLQALSNGLPSLTGGVAVLAWLTWGVGAVALLGIGLAGHVAVALWRKSKQSTAPQPMPAPR